MTPIFNKLSMGNPVNISNIKQNNKKYTGKNAYNLITREMVCEISTLNPNASLLIGVSLHGGDVTELFSSL